MQSGPPRASSVALTLCEDELGGASISRVCGHPWLPASLQFLYSWILSLPLSWPGSQECKLPFALLELCLGLDPKREQEQPGAHSCSVQELCFILAADKHQVYFPFLKRLEGSLGTTFTWLVSPRLNPYRQCFVYIKPFLARAGSSPFAHRYLR